MHRADISRHFQGIAAKRLSAVEADPAKSNQHEFNGFKGLIQLFGRRAKGDDLKISCLYLYLGDDQESIERYSGEATWYESRKHPRSEHRLYYETSAVTDSFREGDLMIFAKRQDGSMMLIAAKGGSVTEKQLLWLFSLSSENLETVAYKDMESEGRYLGFAEKLILEELGIEAIAPLEDLLGAMLDRFQGRLPSTLVFSEYARQHSAIHSSIEDPDAALIEWVQREEQLFRAFEKHLVAERLKQGFGKDNDDVDSFIEFSLSVLNRRKARMGKSFENHLEVIFREHELTFARGAKTERKRTPDFLFPGIDAYRDASFPNERLTMLGAKSTCKERWAQVLNEADRISRKHLVTLEPSITEDQTEEMESSSLQLVVPDAIQKSYTQTQQSWLMDVKEFISLARERQAQGKGSSIV